MSIERACQDLAHATTALQRMRDATTLATFRGAVNRFSRATRGVLSALAACETNDQLDKAMQAARAHPLSKRARLRVTTTSRINPYDMRFEHDASRAAILVCADYLRLLEGLLAISNHVDR